MSPRLDYNNDGCTDIFFTNGAAIPSLRKTGPEFYNRLFRNNCDLTFTDVTAEAGLAGEGYSTAVAIGDFDNDGHPDIFVAGVKGNTLYRNLGNGRFADVTDTPASPASTRSSAACGRYRPAGWTTTTMAGWTCSSRTTSSGTPRPSLAAVRPNSSSTVIPRPIRACPANSSTTTTTARLPMSRRHRESDASIGKGMGVAFADIDGDGLTDIFVANDSVRNFLFRNQGDGTFQEIGLEAGVALRDDGFAIAGMGGDFRDFDNDGKPDLVVSGILNDSFLLFRNLGGAGCFEDFALALRPDDGDASNSPAGVWGCTICDNDGWKDLFFALSHLAQMDRYAGPDSVLPNRVFRNLGGKRFEDVSAAAGPDFQRAAMHRGVAFADFDNDGRVDAVVSVVNGPAKLFRNITGGESHWLAVRLQGRNVESSGTRRGRPRASAGWPRPVQPGHHRGGVRLLERSPGTVRTGFESSGGKHRGSLAGRRYTAAQECRRRPNRRSRRTGKPQAKP